MSALGASLASVVKILVAVEISSSRTSSSSAAVSSGMPSSLLSVARKAQSSSLDQIERLMKEKIQLIGSAVGSLHSSQASFSSALLLTSVLENGAPPLRCWARSISWFCVMTASWM